MSLTSGTRAAQPAAGAVAVGDLYRVTDEGFILERSDGTTWLRQAPGGYDQDVWFNHYLFNMVADPGFYFQDLGSGAVDARAWAIAAFADRVEIAPRADNPAWSVQNTGLTIYRDGTIEIAGGQIQFPATQNPSADPNCYDDYEEGEFDPAISATTSASSQTYAFRSGRYCKRGGWVDLTLEVDLSAKGSMTGQVLITGLPFEVKTTSPTEYPSAYCGYVAGLAGATWAWINGFVEGGSAQIYVVGMPLAGATATQAVTDADVTNTTSFLFNVGYPTED